LEMFKTKSILSSLQKYLQLFVWFGLYFFITTPLFCLFYSYILINGFQWCYTRYCR
jgi:hypothetical protein